MARSARNVYRRILVAGLLTSSLIGAAIAVPIAQGPAGSAAKPDPMFNGLEFRSIGPATMAGRVDDLAVLESKTSTFYVASATAGLWKTINNGITWEVLFQDEEVVSIGDVTIPPIDANLVWVGTGEANNRQSSSWGNGVYKSTDGGHTWKQMGLTDTKHIGRILIDPVDHDIVYVAALGHLWGPNKERGVFKTTDGGVTWTNVLFIDQDTGATDLVMDPSNNKVLYAATYQRRRATWGFNGGGSGSAIYKSGDAGRTWTKLTKGIPEGPLGRIGLDVYRRNSNILYAMIEHERESGVYRSEDGGASWVKMSNTNPRPMYFSQVRIDPNDDDRIYVLGVQIHISDDGGKTFIENGTLHSDHHAMWINPADSNHVMTGNDGGIGVSYDRGVKWDFVDNMVMSQFYHISYDMETPYNVCGGLQDNYSWCGPSAVRGRFGISNWDWFVIGGGDGFVSIVDPKDPRTIYTESQNGNIIRTDGETNERKSIRPTVARSETALRWNWDTPLLISAHNSSTLFSAANRVFKSPDRGHSWAAISSDLTSNADREELSLMGVVGKDIKIAKNDGIAAYPTLVAFAESPKKAGLLYAGGEDGSVQVTRDDGKTWTNLSGRFPGAPKNAYVSRIAASAFEEGTVYVTFDNHREDDDGSYVYASTDYGNSWKSISSNLPGGQAVSCITEDHRNSDVLYLGTEFGLFVSLNKGGSWSKLKSNLPTVPIDEITLHPRENDMLLATHGRGVWILDDLAPIQQAAAAMKASAYLFDSRPAEQFNPASDRTNFAGDRRFWGQNPDFGAGLAYYLRDSAKDLKLSIRDGSGTLVRELTGDAVKNAKNAGLNRIYWDLRHEPHPASRWNQAQGGGGGFGGAGRNAPFVVPGDYRVTLVVDGKDVATKTVTVKGDRLIQITDADRKTWHDTAVGLHELQGTANQAAETIYTISEQLVGVQDVLKAAATPPDAVKTASENLDKRLVALRRQLGVPAPGSTTGFAGGGGGGGGGQQPVRNQVNQLKGQVMASTSLPTDMQTRTMTDAQGELTKIIDETNAIITTALPELYKLLGSNNVQPSSLKPIKSITTSAAGR